MGFYQSLTEWCGKPVRDWRPGDPIDDPTGTAYKLSVEYDSGESWTEFFAQFLDTENAEQVTALVVGVWDEDLFEDPETSSAPAVELIAAASDRLPDLASIFFGDIMSEECEISWLTQSDLSPLFNAYPRLEHFGVRGTNGLALGQISLPHLRTLTIESGGMPASVFEDALNAELPALEHLELYLGAEGYGGEVTVEMLAPILEQPERWPKLTYLGLRDSEITDEIAEALVNAPILKQLTELDLSLGTLTDRGAEALANNPMVASLKKLTLHHHFISEEGVAKLQALKIELDVDDRQKGWEHNGVMSRYVAIAE